MPVWFGKPVTYGGKKTITAYRDTVMSGPRVIIQQVGPKLAAYNVIDHAFDSGRKVSDNIHVLYRGLTLKGAKAAAKAILENVDMAQYHPGATLVFDRDKVDPAILEASQ